MAPDPPEHLVRAQLERIERSAAFAKADRLRAFLRYVVDQALAGAARGIKEYSIALAVCGRPPSFDPKLDPIVRVDASRLRARLEAYYADEGRDDAVRIHLPKGTYVPTFTAAAAAMMPPADPRAYVEYLKGRHHWNRRTAASLDQSLEYYRRALAIDPRCAPAHCGIADTFLVQALNERVDAGTALVEASAHASQAMELAPYLAEAVTSAAAVASILEWDWDRGDNLFRRAIELNPRFALAHYLYAIFNLAPRGRWDDALMAMDRALELDPVSPVLNRDLGIVHYLRGKFGEAEDALHAAEVLDPAFRGSLFWLGRTYAEQGRLQEALDTLEARRHEPAPNSRLLASVVHTLGAMGRTGEAARRLVTLRRERGVPPLNLAIASLGLGRYDDALDHLERALSERAVPLYQLAVDPVYRPLRGSSRFRGVLRRMKLDAA